MTFYRQAKEHFEIKKTVFNQLLRLSGKKSFIRLSFTLLQFYEALTSCPLPVVIITRNSQGEMFVYREH